MIYCSEVVVVTSVIVAEFVQAAEGTIEGVGCGGAGDDEEEDNSGHHMEADKKISLRNT
jgi:hypothetical protein